LHEKFFPQNKHDRTTLSIPESLLHFDWHLGLQKPFLFLDLLYKRAEQHRHLDSIER